MASQHIYHLCRKADWLAATAKGVYEGSEQDRADGFLHFSTSDQVEESAARHLAGVPDLMLLAADAYQLRDSLRWEPAASGELFPHLYGALPLSAILSATPLGLGPDGRHEFPILAD